MKSVVFMRRCRVRQLAAFFFTVIAPVSAAR
jgi:hypothetical protein